MRIALFCPSWGAVGGIEQKAEHLVYAFERAGHTVTVLARDRSGLAPEVQRDVVRMRFRQPPRRLRQVRGQVRFLAAMPAVRAELHRALRTAQADVVLSLAITSYASYCAVLGAEAPVVLSLEGGDPREGGRPANPHRLRRALLRARVVVACAQSVAKAAAALAPPIAGRLRVIPNGVDPERFAAGDAWAHPRPYVLGVGRLARQKGFDVLLEAMAGLGPAGANVDCLLAGDGPDAGRLAELATRLGLGGRLHLLGAVEASRVPALYRGALLVACPSRWEGLPLVCLEAMASGRAVVGSCVDGIPEAVVPGETGVLVPPDDAPALAGALGALIADAARREQMGARGRDRIRLRFTWDRVAAEYLDALETARRRRGEAATTARRS